MTHASDNTPPAISLEDFNRLLAEQHPFAAAMGIDILDIGHGTALLRLPRRDEHERLGGIVAGPTLMGLADLALYAAVVGATGNIRAVTASLTIHFLRKTPPGNVLAHARVLKTGRLTAGDVVLTGEQGGELIAQVVSTWTLPKRVDIS